MKEGAGALGRIDRELDSLLAEHGHKSVSEIVGKIRFRRMSTRAIDDGRRDLLRFLRL